MCNSQFRCIQAYFKTLVDYENHFDDVIFTFETNSTCYKKTVKGVSHMTNTQIVQALHKAKRW